MFLNNVVQMDPTDFTIQFPTQTTVGDYHIVVGPSITDLFGVAMDQPNNGTTGQPNDAYAFDLNLIQATADLTPDAVTVSPSGVTGSSFTVNWRVTNKGSAITPSALWTDSVFLSANGVLDANSLNLGSFGHTGTLVPGQQLRSVADVYSAIEPCGRRVHRLRAGRREQPGLGVCTAADKIGQSLGSISVTLSPAADLNADSVAATSAAATIGQSVQISWKVDNLGNAAATAPWTDKLYLSPDGKFSDATFIGSFAENTNLPIGQSYTQTQTFTLPTVPDGTYTLLLTANANPQVFGAISAMTRLLPCKR